MIANRLNTRWDLVALGVLVNMCLGTVYSWSVFRAPLEESLALTTAQSGLPYSVFLAVFAFSMPIAGLLMARIGTRVTLLVGGLLVGAGWISGGLISSFVPLVISYGVVGGAGVGFAYGVPLAVAGSWFPARRGLAMGVTLAGFGVSPFVTAPLAELLIVRIGAQPAMVALGAGFVVVIPALAVFFTGYEPDAERARPSKAASQASARPNARPAPEATSPPAAAAVVEEAPAPESDALHDVGPATMLRSRNFYGLWIAYVIGTLCGLTAIGMTASFAQQTVGLSGPAAAAAVSAFGMLNGIGRPIFGAVHDSVGVRRSVVVAFVLIALGAGAALLAGPQTRVPFFVAFGIFWLMLGGWLAIAPAATTRLFGARNYVKNYGIMYTAYGVGALAGGAASGALFERFGSHTPLFAAILGLCVVGSVVAVTVIREP
jgi:MFS transporter, OFA family, oxalate/formate antiporter